MEANPIFKLQNTLLHIIDTAALSDKMSNFAFDNIEAITKFVNTGKWETKVPGVSLLIPPTSQNLLITRPQHFDYTKPTPFLTTQSAEVERVENRLSGFVPKDSHAWEVISELYGSDVKQIHLRAIAQDIASHLCIKLDRDAKRRKTVLIKWFEENWEKVSKELSKYKINGEIVEKESKAIEQ